MSTLFLLLCACGQSCIGVHKPMRYSLVNQEAVRVRGMNAQVSAHGGMRSEASHLGMPPSRVTLLFVREGEETLMRVEEGESDEIWGHSFVVLGHEMDTLWICPPGWSAGSEGCVEPVSAGVGPED